MSKVNINWSKVGIAAKEVCNFLVCSTLIALPYMSSSGVLDRIRYRGDVGYSDAVEAIMNSTMYSGDKTEAVSSLRRTSTSEFYKGIIQVANSHMYSGDKVKTIKNMNGITEE